MSSSSSQQQQQQQQPQPQPRRKQQHETPQLVFHPNNNSLSLIFFIKNIILIVLFIIIDNTTTNRSVSGWTTTIITKTRPFTTRRIQQQEQQQYHPKQVLLRWPFINNNDGSRSKGVVFYGSNSDNYNDDMNSSTSLTSTKIRIQQQQQNKNTTSTSTTSINNLDKNTTIQTCYYRSNATMNRWKQRSNVEELYIGQELHGVLVQEYITNTTTGPKLFFDCGIGRYNAKKQQWSIQNVMLRLQATSDKKKKEDKKLKYNKQLKDSVIQKRVKQFRTKSELPGGVTLYVSRIQLPNKLIEVVLSSDEVDTVQERTNPLIPIQSIQVGTEYNGIVKRIESYGVFININANRNGLLHIKQIANYYQRYIPPNLDGIRTVGQLSIGTSIAVHVLSNDKKRLFLDYTNDAKQEMSELLQKTKKKKNRPMRKITKTDNDDDNNYDDNSNNKNNSIITTKKDTDNKTILSNIQIQQPSTATAIAIATTTTTTTAAVAVATTSTTTSTQGLPSSSSSTDDISSTIISSTDDVSTISTLSSSEQSKKEDTKLYDYNNNKVVNPDDDDDEVDNNEDNDDDTEEEGEEEYDSYDEEREIEDQLGLGFY